MNAKIRKASRKGKYAARKIMGKKKWQVTYIAPLQPNILAAFLPWGGSSGAGRIRLAAAKVELLF